MQDFINGQNLNDSTSLEEAKKIMQLALKNKSVFEGDKTNFGKDRSVQEEVKYRWPNGEVPYIVENVFDTDEKAVIASVGNIFLTKYPIFQSLTGNPEHRGQLLRHVPPSTDV